VRRAVLAAVVAALLCASGATAAPVLRISAVGDIAMVSSSYAPSFFSQARLDLVGDLVIGNLEGTLTDRGYSKCGSGSSNCFAFRAPPSYASLLREAGFNAMSVANNHAYDFGEVGQADTLNALGKFGITSFGRPAQIAYMRSHGIRIALVGFAPYPWAQSLLNIPAAKRLVRRAQANADIVIVTMHAGAEGVDHAHVRKGMEDYLGEQRGNSVAFTHAVIDAGADLVIGSGPHVLRGMEWYRNRLIAYSLGNFLGVGTLSYSGMLAVTGVLQVALRPDGSWVAGNLVPMRIASPGEPVPDPSEQAHGVVRTLSLADFGRNGIRVSREGVLLPPG
jgi:hypothetical protein